MMPSAVAPSDARWVTNSLAAISLSTAGVPCVIGGAATSAVLNYWAAQ